MSRFLKTFTVLVSVACVTSLKLEDQVEDQVEDQALPGGEYSRDTPVVWEIEVKGAVSTNPYWKNTWFCGNLKDKFKLEQRTDITGKCKDTGGFQWFLVREQKLGDVDDVFIRKLGCADQMIGIQYTNAVRYNRNKCGYPALSPYSYDLDCGFDEPNSFFVNTKLSSEFTSSHREAEECAQLCDLRSRLVKNGNQQGADCKSWVVEKNATEWRCKLSGKSLLRKMDLPELQKQDHQCGTKTPSLGGTAWTARTPAPTPMGACSSYITVDKCPASKCEWTNKVDGGWGLTTLESPTCRDNTEVCSGPGGGRFPLADMMAAISPGLERLTCNILGIIKALVGMIASFRQNAGAGGFKQAMEQTTETKDLAGRLSNAFEQAGVQVSAMEMDHNDEPTETFPTAFPEPKAHATKKVAVEDMDTWRSRLKKERLERSR